MQPLSSKSHEPEIPAKKIPHKADIEVWDCFSSLRYQIVSLLERIKQLVYALFYGSPTLPTEKSSPALEPIRDTRPNPTIVLDSGSSIIYNRNGEKDAKYVYICKAPPIKNLVISGGAAKGVILPGVVKAFETHKKGEASLRDGLDNIAASSIGAVVGLLVAAGRSAREIIKVTDYIDFKALLGTGIGPIAKDGKPFLDLMRKELKAGLTNNLKKIFKVQDLKEIKQRKLRDIIHELGKPHEEMRITFSMLKQLHKLNPKVFKTLTVTATCRETGTTFYFDAEKTPHLDVTLGARASASLPIILKPVRIEPDFLKPGYETKKTLSFVDGGYLDNIPVEAMNKKHPGKHSRGVHDQNLQTLALIFDTTGQADETHNSPFLEVNVAKHTLYDSSNIIDRLMRDHIATRFGKIKTGERSTKRKEHGLEQIRLKYTQRHIPLLVSVGGNDFDKAQAEKKQNEKQGYKQGMQYLNTHKDELLYRSFATVKDLLGYMPEDERKQVKGGLERFTQEIQGKGA